MELAYGVNSDHRGRGYAIECVNALVDFAFSNGNIRTVRAHTQVANIASQRVLVKAGFRRIGEVFDPEDGSVLRWERHNPLAERHPPKSATVP